MRLMEVNITTHMARLVLNDTVKQRYYIRRDDSGDEYLALRGSKALGNGGLDHIYLMDTETVGLWITSGAINSTIRRLQAKVPGMRVEQLGGGEAVLSAPLIQLDTLCQAAGARIRPHLTDEQKKRLTERIKPFRFSKRDAKEKQQTA